MAAPEFNAEDYRTAMAALLPRGPAWPREPDSILMRVLGALAPSYVRNNARANYLLVDAFPSTTLELLEEWEATLGLPDPCAGEATTILERRAQVVAKLTGLGGQSKSYYIGVAAALGYTITITEFKPFTVGDPVGLPLYGADWAHAWQVTAPLNTVAYFEVGAWRAGDPLARWGNAVLECVLENIKPAHTELIFSYI